MTDAGGTGSGGVSGPAGMSAAQQRTWEAFRRCAPPRAVLDQLRVDGSFTYRAESIHDSQTIKRCMSPVGYQFDY